MTELNWAFSVRDPRNLEQIMQEPHQPKSNNGLVGSFKQGTNGAKNPLLVEGEMKGNSFSVCGSFSLSFLEACAENKSNPFNVQIEEGGKEINPANIENNDPWTWQGKCLWV